MQDAQGNKTGGGGEKEKKKKKNVKRYVEKEKLIWYAREIAGNSTRMPPLYRFANDACELWFVECVILLGKYGVFGASECKRGIRGEGEGYLRIFPLYSEKYNGGIGMGDEIIAAFVGDRSFVTCDRLNKHPFMNSCF